LNAWPQIISAGISSILVKRNSIELQLLVLANK
jgi:hypothetical protein